MQVNIDSQNDLQLSTQAEVVKIIMELYLQHEQFTYVLLLYPILCAYMHVCLCVDTYVGVRAHVGVQTSVNA